MTPPTHSDAPISNDTVHSIFRAIRFAFVCVIFGLSYFGIRVAIAIPKFRSIVSDMLEGAALPWLTTMALQGHHFFLIASWLFPAIALWTLFTPIKPRSFYILGALALTTILQTVVICTALSNPLIGLVDQLGDAAPQSAPR